MSDDVLADFAEASSDDVGRLLGGATRSLNQALFRRLGESGHHDIRPAHVPVFAGLEPGGTRISTLASRAGVTRQAMGAMVREVEALGYIESAADPQDARATLVRLTDTGIEFCRTVIDISTTINNELDLVLGESASERLRSQLRVIAEYR